MKFLLMMTGTQRGVDAYRAWTPGDIQNHFAHLGRLNRELSDAGELVANEPLAAPDQARVVRAGADGLPVTDGVFPESKEFLLGYWIVDVEGPERAHAIAARLSAGPGPGGKPVNMPIEVRQIMRRQSSDLG